MTTDDILQRIEEIADIVGSRNYEEVYDIIRRNDLMGAGNILRDIGYFGDENHELHHLQPFNPMDETLLSRYQIEILGLGLALRNL